MWPYAMDPDDAHHRLEVGRVVCRPLSSEYGTYKAIKARFWPWFSGQKILDLSLLGGGS